MGDDDDAFPLVMGCFTQNLCNVLCCLFIQIASWLVSKNDRRLRNQRPTDRHPLLLTTG